MVVGRTLKTFANKLFWSLLIWISASFLFGLIRIWGVESLPAFERIIPFRPFQFVIQMLVLGVAVGIPFGIMDRVLDNNWIKRKSYWQIILFNVIIQVMLALFSLGVLVVLSKSVFNTGISLFEAIFSETSLLWIIYTGIVSAFIYFLQVVKTKIGDRVLVNLILGKYHFPTVEHRIFMFLDMKDSTTHAENLGHIKFSTLIQDSLNDLTAAIIEHKVEVYKYVGDEAILTWDLEDGFENANCLQAYYTISGNTE